MSFLHPLDALRQVPGFLHTLETDLRFLAAPDLPRTMAAPPRDNFVDEGCYGMAVVELRRQYMFAVVRQAVRKQEIRQSLWPRFLTCWMLAAPLTFPLCMLLPVIWVSYMWSNPQIY